MYKIVIFVEISVISAQLIKKMTDPCKQGDRQ